MTELHVVFKLGEASYVVPAADVLHMESYTGATPVPGTAPWVAGLVQIRRRVVPVVDVRIRFGLAPAARDLNQRVIVVQSGARQVGLLVDSAREVVKLGADQFRAPPEVVSEGSHGFVRAVAQVKERLVMLLDVNRVVGTEGVPEAPQEMAHGK